MSVLAAILEEAETLTITRHAAGTRSLGRVTPGSTSTLPAVVAVQPLQAREAQMLPEGVRSREGLVLYGADKLLAADPDRQAEGDKFTRGGATFEVVKSEDWFAAGGYYRSVAVKIGG